MNSFKKYVKFLSSGYFFPSYISPLTVNRSCKAHIRKSTHQWITNKVQKQLESDKQPENVTIDTKLSIIKPLHGKWVTSFHDSMQTNKSIVTKGWDQAGITQFLKIDPALKQDDPFDVTN